MLDDSSRTRVVELLRDRARQAEVGARLPSSRDLVAQLGVGPVTVQRALAQLVAEGVVVTRPGAGTYVARPPTPRVDDTAWQQVALGASPVRSGGIDIMLKERAPETLQFGSGYLDASARPDARLATAMARAARRPDAWDRPPPAGIAPLRSWFAAQVGAAPDDVLVTTGGQGALSAIIRGLLPSGHPVLFATPTYPGAVAVARSAGLVPVPVPTDGDGVRPELLERAFATTGARLLYLQPTFANPDGHVLAPERRPQVLAAAEAAGAFVIEDDWARWLGHGTPVPPPLMADDRTGHVVTVLSLTKVAAAGLRVGAIVARGPVAHRIGEMRLVDDFFVARPMQEAAVELVSASSWPAYHRALSATLRDRLAVLATSLARRMPDCRVRIPAGGVSLWLGLPSGINDLEMAERAAAEGVAVVPGRHYVVGEPIGGHLRLSWAGLPAGSIDTAVERLARALEACRPRPGAAR